MNKRQLKKSAAKSIKSETVINVQTMHTATVGRFNVLRSLSASDLTRYIESFETGDFYWLARTMAAMERRDHTWKIAAAKARKDVSRRQWQCVPLDGYKQDDEAANQADTLTEFYSRLRVTDFRCRNVSSGVRGLVNNIMRAYNDWFSVQEVVFRPTASGHLTADIMQCPLTWFELRDGYLHLRLQSGQTQSSALEAGGWLIAQGDGVGIACAVAYQFKRMALGDLAIYSGRCGQPGIHGKTNAAKNTTEWNNMADAVKNFGKEFSAVTGLDDILEKIDLSISGQLPQPIIIEMMDRAISSLQRGADLSTMSAGTGSGEGASVQVDESNLITADNCAMVTETLQTQLDPIVLAWHYGPNVQIKAGFEIIPPEADTTQTDLQIDRELVNMGVKLSRKSVLERYNRTEADLSDPDDSPLTPASSQSALLPPASTSFANEAEPSPGSHTPVDGTDTPADRGGSTGIDPAAKIINAAAAKILDGSVPFDDAMAAALAELEKLPEAAADLPDTLEKQITKAMFVAAADNIQETA